MQAGHGWEDNGVRPWKTRMVSVFPEGYKGVETYGRYQLARFGRADSSVWR
jgi:hypothetical protein